MSRKGFERLGDHRLQRMSGDGQGHPGESGHVAAPSGGGVQHHVGLDETPAGLDAGDAAVGAVYAGDLGEGVQLGAAAVSGATEPPDHGVVADDAAGRMVQRAEDGVGQTFAQAHGGHQFLDFRRANHPAVDPQDSVELGSHPQRVQGGVGVAKVEGVPSG